MKWIKYNDVTENEIVALLNKIRVEFIAQECLQHSNEIYPAKLVTRLNTMWHAQIRNLLFVSADLRIVNTTWDCEIAKDACFLPNMQHVIMRGFCRPEENVAYPPILFHKLEN